MKQWEEKDMTENRKTDIATLLEKYMDGETSNTEETLLRNYFRVAGNDIPQEWRVYKALFTYEEKEKETADNKAKNVDSQTKKSVRPVRRRILHIAGLTAVAASATILICLLLTLPQEKQNYAMIDGKKYTGKEIVMKEAEDALILVSADEDETFDALGQIQ